MFTVFYLVIYLERERAEDGGCYYGNNFKRVSMFHSTDFYLQTRKAREAKGKDKVSLISLIDIHVLQLLMRWLIRQLLLLEKQRVMRSR